MKKILIIEDEKILVELYQDKFSQVGYEVSTAFTSEEGLELAKREKPDLILLDILLPTENGIGFLKKLRETPEISGIPVIVFSNYDNPEARKEAKELGIKDYLIKTQFTPTELIEKIKKIIGQEENSQK